MRVTMRRESKKIDWIENSSVFKDEVPPVKIINEIALYFIILYFLLQSYF
jgi:hypothetical protein